MAGPSRKHEDRHEEFVFRVRRPQPPTASAFSLIDGSTILMTSSSLSAFASSACAQIALRGGRLRPTYSQMTV